MRKFPFINDNNWNLRIYTVTNNLIAKKNETRSKKNINYFSNIIYKF